MAIVGWIIFGLFAGFIASKIVNAQGEGCFLNLALGLVGSLVGGFVFQQLTGSSPYGVNFFLSMIVAVVGAVVVLLLYHAATGRRGLR